MLESIEQCDHLPHICDRPTQVPSSQMIFHVVLSPAMLAIQLNVISVPDSKPDSSSASSSGPLLRSPNCNIVMALSATYSLPLPIDQSVLHARRRSTVTAILQQRSALLVLVARQTDADCEAVTAAIVRIVHVR